MYTQSYLYRSPSRGKPSNSNIPSAAQGQLDSEKQQRVASLGENCKIAQKAGPGKGGYFLDFSFGMLS